MREHSPAHHRANRRHLTLGVLLSLLVHSTTLAALIVAQYEPPWPIGKEGGETRALEVRYGEPREASTPIAQAETPSAGPPETRTVTDVSEVTDDLVRDRLVEVADKANAASTEENWASLERLTQQLNQVSTAASVDQMAAALQRITGTKPRAQRPAEQPVAGEFDHVTAQLHDVRRLPQDPGDWRYVAVLLDAEGRTMEVELDAVAGEQLYVTLERIKANPLLEQVYRQIAIPLFDRLLGGLKHSSPAKKEEAEVPH
jgi:hypothetical protein